MDSAREMKQTEKVDEERIYTMPGPERANGFFSMGSIDGRLPTDTEIDQSCTRRLDKQTLGCWLKSHFIWWIHAYRPKTYNLFSSTCNDGV